MVLHTTHYCVIVIICAKIYNDIYLGMTNLQPNKYLICNETTINIFVNDDSWFMGNVVYKPYYFGFLKFYNLYRDITETNKTMGEQ